MAAVVGFGFRPYDEELVNDYLNVMTLGLTELVDNAISEVNIYSFDPWELRFQSRIDTSGDSVWYFFYRLENKKLQSRKTRSGFWKKTGPTLDIKRRRGIRDKIGEKKVLVFHLGRTPNGVGTEWVMHEYHTTFFPADQRTYVICKVEFKGEDLAIPSANGAEPSRSLNNVGDSSTGSVVVQQDHGNSWQAGQSQGSEQFGGSLSRQPQSPNLDFEGMRNFVGNLTEKEWNLRFKNSEIDSYNVMQEDYNGYRPHKSLTGLCSDCSSDSDDESSSPTDHKETRAWNVDGASTTNGQCQAEKKNIRTPSTDHQAEGHPRRLQLQGKYQRVMMPPQEKGENDYMQQMEKEMKTAQDTSIKGKSHRKGCLVFEGATDKSRNNKLINTIVGFILFLLIIRELTSVR
ncbi:PREDICTED: NAC domain-containing protein 69-like [Tarenaya hassleriana]|uniref:NAC domain-containing protein 69-like n=1 Tax=Tarenaya hassleriana TaxID=28532 RepID=UPI00053C5371|nr:PREDICTED: NAC domain-containing protein 69-like [Tarenaya hassleriana]